MKTVFKTISLILSLSLAYSLQAETIKKCIAVHTGKVLVNIDGQDKETFWETIKMEEINQFANNIQVPKSNYFVRFKMAYDSMNLYCMAYITDLHLVSWVDIGREAWNSDCIEMFFNPLDIEETQFPFKFSSECHFMAGVNDGKYKNWFSGQGYCKNYKVDRSRYMYHTYVTDSGYNLEIQLPWEVLFDRFKQDAPVIEPGTEISWEINGCDADNVSSARYLIMGWNADWTESWRNNTRYGKLVLGQQGTTNVNRIKSQAPDFHVSYNNNMLDLSITGTSNGEVTIYDLNGRTMIKTRILSTSESVNIGSLNTGIYYVQVKNETGILVKKFFKN